MSRVSANNPPQTKVITIMKTKFGGKWSCRSLTQSGLSWLCQRHRFLSRTSATSLFSDHTTKLNQPYLLCSMVHDSTCVLLCSPTLGIVWMKQGTSKQLATSQLSLLMRCPGYFRQERKTVERDWGYFMRACFAPPAALPLKIMHNSAVQRDAVNNGACR